MGEVDYYAVLGVSRDANDEEIKRAYRKLARQLHPDVNHDKKALEQIKELNTAHDVLSDPEKRRIYHLGGNPLRIPNESDAGPAETAPPIEEIPLDGYLLDAVLRGGAALADSPLYSVNQLRDETLHERLGVMVWVGMSPTPDSVWRYLKSRKGTRGDYTRICRLIHMLARANRGMELSYLPYTPNVPSPELPATLAWEGNTAGRPAEQDRINRLLPDFVLEFKGTTRSGLIVNGAAQLLDFVTFDELDLLVEAARYYTWAGRFERSRIPLTGFAARKNQRRATAIAPWSWCELVSRAIAQRLSMPQEPVQELLAMVLAVGHTRGSETAANEYCGLLLGEFQTNYRSTSYSAGTDHRGAGRHSQRDGVFAGR